MSVAPRPLTEHRLARLLLWARLWLEAVARLLPALGRAWPPAQAWIAPLMRQRLGEMRRLIALFLFIRAMARLAPIATKRTPPWRRRTRPGSAIRNAIGSSVRRALRRKDLRAQINALLDILRDPEPMIARLATRLRRWRPRQRETYDFIANVLRACVFATRETAAPNTS